MFEYVGNYSNVTQWVTALGYVGLLLIIFLETGVFVCFFLPGDSLIFTAGLLASRGVFDIKILVPALMVTAMLGYVLGYWVGDKLGHWLIKRPDTFYFKKRYLTQAQAFYGKHGGKALILGRLLPIVRTFTPIVAGMVEMPYKQYTLYNFVGAVIWGGGVTMVGYYLGSVIPQADHYLLYVVMAIIFVTLAPTLWHYCRERR